MADISIHRVQSISVESGQVGEKAWMDFTFTDADGHRSVVTAYCRAGVEIEGAEFANFVTAHSKEPA